jgi:hypothetical protein
VNFSQVGFSGAVTARDLWAAKDLGRIDHYQAVVPGHGVVLLRVSR